MKDLTYKTYVFVEKHLSPIDKGIQASHAVIEFYNEAKLWNKIKENSNFDRWAHFDKTLILLDGGSVNNLDEIDEILSENLIHHGSFREPDMDNILTAIAVVVDERVFNRKEYPDYQDWLIKEKKMYFANSEDFYYYFDISNCNFTNNNIHKSLYKEWVEFVGGKENVVLRELINNRKLAR